MPSTVRSFISNDAARAQARRNAAAWVRVTSLAVVLIALPVVGWAGDESMTPAVAQATASAASETEQAPPTGDLSKRFARLDLQLLQALSTATSQLAKAMPTQAFAQLAERQDAQLASETEFLLAYALVRPHPALEEADAAKIAFGQSRQRPLD